MSAEGGVLIGSAGQQDDLQAAIMVGGEDFGHGETGSTRSARTQRAPCDPCDPDDQGMEGGVSVTG